MELLTAALNNSNGFPSLAPGFDENQIFYNSENQQRTKDVLKVLNAKLAVKKTRRDAISYLNLVISQTRNLEPVLEFCNLWMFHCLRECETANSSEGFKLLRKLVLSSKVSPDLKTQVLHHFNEVVKLILSKEVNCNEDIAVLQCLEACLVVHPGSCGQHRTGIEKKLLRYIDVDNINKVRLAGRCLHLLQQVSGGSTQGVNHKTQWVKQLEKICGTLHSILTEIYNPLTELFQAPSDEMSAYTLPEINENDILNQMSRLSLRFCNTSLFLIDMIGNPFPVAKTINIDMIFAVISKGLMISCDDLSSNLTLDQSAIQIIIPKLHQSLFELLSTFILSLRSNLYPYSHKICHYIVKSLQWTKKMNNNTPYRSLKVTVYKCFNTWLSLAKATSCVQHFAKELIPLLLEDSKAFNEDAGSKVVLLKTTKHKSKKKINKIVENSLSTNKFHGELTLDLCMRVEIINCAALKSLQHVIKSAGPYFEIHYHKDIQEFIVHRLLESQTSRTSCYKDIQCRLELYKTLSVLIDNPHPTLPPPLQYAIEIFSTGQHDPNPDISSLCTNSLATVDKIIHPACSTLNYPREYFSNLNFRKSVIAETSNEIASESVNPAESVIVKVNGRISESNEKPAEQMILTLSDDDDENDVVCVHSGLQKDLDALKQAEELNEEDDSESDDESDHVVIEKVNEMVDAGSVMEDAINVSDTEDKGNNGMTIDLADGKETQAVELDDDCNDEEQEMMLSSFVNLQD